MASGQDSFNASIELEDSFLQPITINSSCLPGASSCLPGASSAASNRLPAPANTDSNCLTIPTDSSPPDTERPTIAGRCNKENLPATRAGNNCLRNDRKRKADFDLSSEEATLPTNAPATPFLSTLPSEQRKLRVVDCGLRGDGSVWRCISGVSETRTSSARGTRESRASNSSGGSCSSSLLVEWSSGSDHLDDDDDLE